MSKKVFELAKELDIGAIDLVEKLKDMGMNVRNHMVKLSDEEVEKAMEAFAPAKEAPKKKKVTKKKVAKKKKVVKKVVKKAAAKKEETAPEPEAEVEEEKVEAKPQTVVRKKKVVKKKAATKKADDADAKTDASEETSEEGKPEKEVFKEKMHAFTPVYVPEKSEEDSEKSTEAKKSAKANERFAVPGEDDPESGKDERGASKKRMGDLASIVSKKGAGKSKDMTQIKADEQMKFASNVVGRVMYTPTKKKKIYTGESKKTEITEVKDSKRVINIYRVTTGAELAQKLSQKFSKFQNRCLEINLLVKEDDYIGLELAGEIASLYDYRVEDKAFDESDVIDQDTVEDKSHLPVRNPIITVMGHVDHGKTTLLDHIRKTKVTEGEAGGITQHIGAYSVKVGKSTLTFLDTPGHAAFASMRQRGANVTDVVILVVAADDGVMPQTKESIKFAKNAGCPIIVAVNKMDKEGANPERVKQELTEFELVPEEWGGETLFANISALNGDGIDDLLEQVKLQAELLDLREDPKGAVEGVIIESKIETGRGPVATVLVQKGTLKKGDAVVCGECHGRARTLMDTTGKSVKEAGPSIPVQILGLDAPPSPGELLNVVKNEREARKVVDNRISERKALENVETPKVASLEDFFANADVQTGEKKVLNLVVRSDVQGSYEAIKEALQALGNDEVGLEIIAGGVGAITDNDVIMASNTNGYIIGFNMRPVTSARKLSEEQGVEIRTYSIIYELIEDVTLALEGMLEPEKVEKYIGRAEVRDTFNIPKVGTIAGCGVIDGKIERGCNIRLLRDGKIVYDGKLSTLKRFKDEVKEVSNGYECGMALEGFNDIKTQDLIEAYQLEEKARKLETASQYN
ncbi:MAG: translation initiation factor IF-2 [Halobacteriovoraceae bacterium]|nr:translation initiation factor IF-2 [Halobacteriovoraceae bacterium]|tara:strand:+ start:1185 stop:3770 length:2586 start_codon:yes stop_codon:yes gene_type:complete